MTEAATDQPFHAKPGLVFLQISSGNVERAEVTGHFLVADDSSNGDENVGRNRAFSAVRTSFATRNTGVTVELVTAVGSDRIFTNLETDQTVELVRHPL